MLYDCLLFCFCLFECVVNLFRYDANILFVRNSLLPRVDGIRNVMAKAQGGDWVKNLRLTISFADGSSARISAINAALRHYRCDCVLYLRMGSEVMP